MLNKINAKQKKEHTKIYVIRSTDLRLRALLKTFDYLQNKGLTNIWAKLQNPETNGENYKYLQIYGHL